MKRTDGAHELLDGPLQAALLEGNLRDLARVNRWLGGSELSWRALVQVIEPVPQNHTVTLLDVGTGAADIPRELVRRAQAAGRQLKVKATDVRPEILAAAGRIIEAERMTTAGAGRLAEGEAGVELALGSPAGLGEADKSFDVVHASLVLHHLELEQARRLLSEMARVARRAVIINDVDRARRWWLGAWLLAHLATTNRYTRHDAPLSVRRAYRPNEVLALAASAGLRERARLTARPAYRYALVLG